MSWLASSDIPQLPGALAIGRYFTVVSLVPSGVFVAYLILLIRSNSWNGGHIDFGHAIGNLNLRDLATFSIGSLLTAMTLHPLQFAIIQAFEGFWSVSKITRRWTLWNVTRHRHRSTNLFSTAIKSGTKELETIKNEEASANEVGAGHATIANWLTGAEAWRQYNDYPDELQYVMPTRLGNVLRRYELLAGQHYGLHSIATVPRMLQVADARDVAYVHNQRMQMELALRTSTLALVATVITAMFMWQHGPWLLLGLAPYFVAYATYRGAVVVAREYGTSLAVLIDLNRFDLYTRMHLPLPDDIEEERENNRLLTNILRLDNVDLAKRASAVYLDYVHPEPPGGKPSNDEASDETGDTGNGNRTP